MTRQHPHVYGVLPGRRLNRFTGPSAQAQTIDDLNADHFDHAGLGFIRGGRIAVTNQALPISGRVSVPPDVQRWGREYKELLVREYESLVVLRANPEMLPYDANFLDLDPDVRGSDWRPVVRITLNMYENERRLMAFLQARATEVIRAMGAERVWLSPVTPHAISTHDLGGTRMGTDLQCSVVDAYGRLHEARRVFVLGGSTFPTQTGLNPTLTIQALALRTSDYMTRAVL